MTKQTSVVSLRTQEMIENEAAIWLAILDGGNLSDGERLELRAWLKQDPEHVRALKAFTSIWSDMDILLNDLPTMSKTDTPGLLTLFMPTRPLFVAIAMIFVCVVGVLIWTSHQPVTTETSFHITGVGVQQLEKFSDGSMAHLNTNSMMEMEYSDSVRIVRLLRGEAIFDVAHDPNRPFIVYAGNQVVKAIGTKFVVRLTSEKILVTVTDGKVQLSKRLKDDKQEKGDSKAGSTQQQEVFVVSKGEEIEVYDEASAPELREIRLDELQRRLSWTEGQLVFKNEPLKYVVREICRYVPDQIIINDPELRDVRISGRFEIGDTDALLEAIEVSFNVQAKHVEGQVIHLSR